MIPRSNGLTWNGRIPVGGSVIIAMYFSSSFSSAGWYTGRSRRQDRRYDVNNIPTRVRQKRRNLAAALARVRFQA